MFIFFLMVWLPPRSKLTDTLCPYSTLFRSWLGLVSPERRGTALPCPLLRCLHDRFRYPQRDAYRQGAGRGVPRAQVRRAVLLPRILDHRVAGLQGSLRQLFAQARAEIGRDAGMEREWQEVVT